jgi:hypothetical protein
MGIYVSSGSLRCGYNNYCIRVTLAILQGPRDSFLDRCYTVVDSGCLRHSCQSVDRRAILRAMLARLADKLEEKQQASLATV